MYFYKGSDYGSDIDYIDEFGEDYADDNDQYSAFTKHLTKIADDDLTYVDKNGVTITILDVNKTCCRPLKVKCTVESNDTEKCTVKKGLCILSREQVVSRRAIKLNRTILKLKPSL